MTRVLVINGHPDAGGRHFAHALTDAYAEAARKAGHEVRRIDVGSLEFDSVRGVADFNAGPPPRDILAAQQALAWAEHWVIEYPLWLGSMPGRLKSFLEQVLRPGFAFGTPSGRGLPPKLLKGHSARIIVTMGMPAPFYKLWYRAHSLKSLERNVLAFCGVSPVRATLIGMVEKTSDAARRRWLAKMQMLGRYAV